MTKVNTRLDFRVQRTSLLLRKMTEGIASPDADVLHARLLTTHHLVRRHASVSRDVGAVPYVGRVSSGMSPELDRCTGVHHHHALIFLECAHSALGCTIQLLCASWCPVKLLPILLAERL